MQLILNILIPLVLRSKIFSLSFQNQRFYTQRSFPHFSKNMLRFQIFSSLFRHHRCCDLRSSLDGSHILTALMLCFSLRFYPIVPSLMLCSKIFSSILKHVWCYALRDSLHLSGILEAPFQDLFFKFQTSVMLHAKIFSSIFQHHWGDALRSSVPFSDIIKAAL